MVVDLGNRIVDVNPAGQQLAPNPEQTLVGKPLAALLGTQAGLVKPAALANHATLGDICLLRAGEERTFELRASPLRDVDSRLEGCLCVLHDITERKQAEEALQLLAQNLEQRVLERTRELHTLGHHLESIREDEQSRIAREIHDELGQALTVLKLNVSWLSRHVQNDGDAVSRRLAAMNDLLGASIETVQRIAAELRPAILDHLGLVAALEWLTRTYEERTGIACTFVHSGEDTVLMDKDLATALFRISQEALTNAARHANARSVDLCLDVTEGEILLEIKDDGIGITQAQVDDPRCVWHHRHARAALSMAGAPDGDRRTRSGHHDLGCDPPAGSTEGGTVIRTLIVDDHKIMREGLIQILSETSDICVVGEAANGREALEKIRQVSLDVVLLDISMPEMDGMASIHAIRHEHPKLAVLVLSMYPEEQYAVRFLKAGAAGYLTKASASDELIDAIRKVASGGHYVTRSLAERLAEELGGEHHTGDLALAFRS